MIKLNLQSWQLNIREILLYRIGKNLIWWLENLVTRYSLIGNEAFFDPKEFPWVTQLENNWQTIRKELDLVLQYADNLPNFHDISPDQARSLTQDNLWKTYFLYGFGTKAEQNCQYCPQTADLLAQIPSMKTAFFSILLPGKHIPEHRGPYKGFIRYHLGLKVPEPREKCRIRVGEETRYWEEGKSLIFDDSFPHEAWNETDGIRVVLFVDIVRPLAFPGSLINQLVINLIAWSPFVKDAKKNQIKWDQYLQKIFNS